MKFKKGIVLFTVLIMVSVLSLLVLSLMQHVLLYVKATNHLNKSHQQFYQLESAARQFILSLPIDVNPQCNHPLTASVKASHLNGCDYLFDHQHYTYFMDDLGEYPCLQIEANHNTWGTHHWLISIGIQKTSFEFIQMRVVTPVALKTCEKIKIIRNNILSWRHGYSE